MCPTRTVDGVELSYRHHPGSRPAIVFVSGLGEPGAVWDNVLERLPGEASTFTYDRAGCGDSGALDPESAVSPRSVMWAAEQLQKLLKAAGMTGPWVLVGHSIGGLIVDAFARRWPDEVSGLVLVDTSDPSFDTLLDNPEEVLVDGRDGEGWTVSFAATAQDFDPGPSRLVETVVIGSAIWRWLRVEDAEPYRPLTLLDADQRWQRHQLELTERWGGHMVVPHTAGHRVHEEAPDLVAYLVRAVADAAVDRGPVQLDQETAVRAGGTVRVSAMQEGLVEWSSTGPRGVAEA